MKFIWTILLAVLHLATFAQDNSIVGNERVGAFRFGESIQSYKLLTGQKIIKTMKSDDEGERYPFYTLYNAGQKIMEVTPAYSDLTESYTDKIDDITVYSTAYSTGYGGRVGMSLPAALNLYKGASILYSYVSGKFWIEQGWEQNVQLIVDGKGFRNKSTNLESLDMIEISLSDFTPGTKIVAIRAYKFND